MVSVQHASGLGVGGRFISRQSELSPSVKPPQSLFSRSLEFPRSRTSPIIQQRCLSPWHTSSKRVKRSGGICSHFNNWTFLAHPGGGRKGRYQLRVFKDSGTGRRNPLSYNPETSSKTNTGDKQAILEMQFSVCAHIFRGCRSRADRDANFISGCGPGHYLCECQVIASLTTLEGK